MQEITEKEHAKALLKLFESNPEINVFYATKGTREPYLNCPHPKVDAKLCCDTCANFLGIDTTRWDCPCWKLGLNEAVKRSWIALEEKGYLV